MDLHWGKGEENQAFCFIEVPNYETFTHLVETYDAENRITLTPMSLHLPAFFHQNVNNV